MNVFHKHKLCILGNWFIAKIISISQKYLFWGYSKWLQIRGLEQWSIMKTLVCAKLVKFTKDSVMCAEKHVSVKTIFTNGLNMGLPELKRQSTKWKQINSPVKKKFWVQWSLKEVMRIVFWGMKELITIDFHENRATVNTASYCQPFGQIHLIEWPLFIYIYISKKKFVGSKREKKVNISKYLYFFRIIYFVLTYVYVFSLLLSLKHLVIY